MELRQIVNNNSSYVNPNTWISVRPSIGYTIGAGAKQIPAYGNTFSGWANIQAIDNEMLKHESFLNIQGTYKVLYLSGQLYAVVEPFLKGGDLVLIQVGLTLQEWLITKIIERYDYSWCKVFICLQSQS